MAGNITPVDELRDQVAAIQERVARVEALVQRLASQLGKRRRAERRKSVQLLLFPDRASSLP